MNNDIIALERKLELAAKIAHNVNQAYCEAIGDPTQTDWENAPQWQKDSCMNGVDFHLKFNTTPEDSHKNWMNHKITDGWKYGKVKDEILKTHPCMVPYDELPESQRVKDYLFKAIVDSIFKE